MDPKRDSYPTPEERKGPPKNAMTAFNFFESDYCSELENTEDFTYVIKETFNMLSPAGLQYYQDLEKQDLKRFER